MSYQDKEIKTIIEDIRDNKLYLPAIQRDLVWKHDQIVKLFDSIMRKYPIGTFLFWKLKGESIHNYTFYKFIQEFIVGVTKKEVAPKPELREEILGVLDGQQRLNSMYIALQGSYAYKRKHASRNNPNAYPKRIFCLNLLSSNVIKEKLNEYDTCGKCSYELPPQTEQCPNCGAHFSQQEDSKTLYEFKFLTESEIKNINGEHFWFPVKDILLRKEAASVNDYCDECIVKYPELNKILKDENKKRQFINNLMCLWQRIFIDKLISYYEIEEDNLDNILDVFVRVNSGGTILSKTNLLFSTIVAHWEKGKDEVESLIESLNSKGDGFNFNNDFVMRASLVLTDCPVLFKVKTFKKENIIKIKESWNNIKSSLEKTVDMIVDFGFNRDNLTSNMAIIPIAYYFMKKWVDFKSDKSDMALIKEYLIKSLLKQIFGGQGDQVLTKIRDAMRNESENNGIITYKLKSENFPLEYIKKTDLPSRKSLAFTEEDINKIIENTTKGPYSFMILSFLYPHLNYGIVKFHQDHLHPKSMFGWEKLESMKLSTDERWKWLYNKDKIANLQLLEGSENKTKNKTPLKKWFKDIKDKDKYKKDNYFPKNVSLEFESFNDFYSKRKEILKEKIKQILTSKRKLRR